MKRLLFLIMILLLMTTGCEYLPEDLVGNQIPTAYIDSISPVEVSQGGKVKFLGHGTDPDGTVVAYRWRSNIDGALDVLASFETTSLSSGKHTIYLKVQDNNGAWSEEVQSAVTVSGGEASTPIISFFKASPAGINSGGSSNLSWEVSGATTVTINQGIGNVDLTGTKAVSPGTTTIYTMTATNATGSATTSAKVTVTSAPVTGLPVVNSFNASPASINIGEYSTLSWNVSNATAVTIDVGIGAVASTGSTTVSPVINTSYTLTATNLVGTVNSTVVVTVSSAPQTELTVGIQPVISESGYVRDNGEVWPEWIYVGDDQNNRSLQAFISFDISEIPGGATITNVLVDFSDHDTMEGDPFGSLGCLRVYPHDYGILDGVDYYSGSPTGHILEYCSLSQITVHGDNNVKDALQAQVGGLRFQLRLQYNENENDGDSTNDLMRWSQYNMPKLIVTYTTS